MVPRNPNNSQSPLSARPERSRSQGVGTGDFEFYGWTRWWTSKRMGVVHVDQILRIHIEPLLI